MTFQVSAPVSVSEHHPMEGDWAASLMLSLTRQATSDTLVLLLPTASSLLGHACRSVRGLLAGPDHLQNENAFLPWRLRSLMQESTLSSCAAA